MEWQSGLYFMFARSIGTSVLVRGYSSSQALWIGEGTFGWGLEAGSSSLSCGLDLRGAGDTLTDIENHSQ